jgi:hypothetical protein
MRLLRIDGSQLYSTLFQTMVYPKGQIKAIEFLNSVLFI